LESTSAKSAFLHHTDGRGGLDVLDARDLGGGAVSAPTQALNATFLAGARKSESPRSLSFLSKIRSVHNS